MVGRPESGARISAHNVFDELPCSYLYCREDQNLLAVLPKWVTHILMFERERISIEPTRCKRVGLVLDDALAMVYIECGKGDEWRSRKKQETGLKG